MGRFASRIADAMASLFQEWTAMDDNDSTVVGSHIEAFARGVPAAHASPSVSILRLKPPGTKTGFDASPSAPARCPKLPGAETSTYESPSAFAVRRNLPGIKISASGRLASHGCFGESESESGSKSDNDDGNPNLGGQLDHPGCCDSHIIGGDDGHSPKSPRCTADVMPSQIMLTGSSGGPSVDTDSVRFGSCTV